MTTNHSIPFHALWRVALGASLGLACSAGAWAAAGTVQFVAGDVRLERAGSQQAVARGAGVEAGDVLKSGADGQAQVRFSDGGIVALYPQSQISISAYSDSAQAGQGEDRFALRFVQGALRAVTGKIGQRNPQNYRVITPTAVVGVRGTAFKVFMNDQGEVEVSGEHNTIDVCTQAGCTEVKPREAVRVISEQQLPVYTHTRAMLPMPLNRDALAPGEQFLPGGSYGAVVLVQSATPTPPVQPVDPGPPPTNPSPTVPVTPTNPGDGVQPTNPTDPSVPGRPVQPNNPNNPTSPGGIRPVTPTVPVTPIIPVIPIRPIRPVAPVVIR